MCKNGQFLLSGSYICVLLKKFINYLNTSFLVKEGTNNENLAYSPTQEELENVSDPRIRKL